MKAGVDIGSISVKYVIVDGGKILEAAEIHEREDLYGALRKLRKELSRWRLEGVGITGSFNGDFLKSIESVKIVNALIRGSLYLVRDVRTIIDAGGTTATLVMLNEDGELKTYRTNSACAAGTGAFLEHQAKRLEVSPEEMGRRCYSSCPPSIATRCAVFAKTDIIHRQQEGYSVEELWNGLCKGVAETLLSTLLKGVEPEGKILLTGGLSRNPLFVRWLREQIGEIEVSVFSPFASAIGASFYASEENLRLFSEEVLRAGEEKPKRRNVLLIRTSAVRESPSGISFTDENGTEVLVSREGFSGDIWLGIDIGSTSTKLCAISEERDVLFHLYRKTKGDPVGATRLLFEAKKEVDKFLGPHRIVGIGTTGSGRKMMGKLLRANLILNEITAHAEGARFQCEGVETLFEIGGQDSKYMHMKNGVVDHINMNYICAAGTGSFIEELAELLGFRIQDVGELVLGVEPPYTSERCTVFMEQDALNLLKKGFSRKEVMAGVIYSVAFNYLSRVVGRRPITGDFILFQGATARNKGLIAAFETILGKKIVTTDLCHINGALGVALHCLKERKMGYDFPLSVLYEKIEKSNEECSLCSNRCKITIVETSEGKTSWGYMCGREPGEERKKEVRGYKAFEERNRLLSRFIRQEGNLEEEMGVPLSLSTHIFMPFYVKFLNELGYRVVFSGFTDDETIKRGNVLSTSEFCLPVKAGIGHLFKLLDKGLEKVFIPYFIKAWEREGFSNTHFCPYLQGIPGIFLSILRTKGMARKVFSPEIDLTLPDRVNIQKLHRAFMDEEISFSVIRNAFKRATEHQREFMAEMEKLGASLIQEMKESSSPAVCIAGRNYTVYDPRLSLRIPFLFATYGVNVMPGEFIPFSRKNFPEGFENMFWFNGQNILNAVSGALKEGFYPVVLSNFSCGPDSFILTYVEMLSGNNPYLILELDEHSSETGFLTRIEAFLDVISNKKPAGGTSFHIKMTGELAGRKILIPNMHPVGNHFFAAVFRKYGYDAETLPNEKRSSFELGRKLTRGSECLPMAVTLGNLLEFIRERGYDPGRVALFMPTSDGPCRFGQYATMQKALLERAGLSGLSVITPSAANAYLGLPDSMRKDLWKAIIAGDILFKIRCKLKPREIEEGATERVLIRCIEKGVEIFERDCNMELFLRYVKEMFKGVMVEMEKKIPLVGVVGEIFVRCNPFSNDYLLEAIERNGGEMWLAPISEWIFFTSFNHLWKSVEKRDYLEVLKNRLKNRFLRRIEERAYDTVEELIGDRREPPVEDVVTEALSFLPKEHTTEAFITIGRALHFIKKDGVSLVVNVSPFTCMPGNIAASILCEIEKKSGIPVVSIFYDGEEGESEKIGVHLHEVKRR